MKLFKEQLLPLLGASLFLLGCGSSSDNNSNPPPPSNAETTTKLNIGAGESSVKVSFTPDSRGLSELNSELVHAKPRLANDSQELLAQHNSPLPYSALWNYTELVPKPELFCSEPTNLDYITLSEKMGGFSKSRRIAIEEDATTPTFVHGFRPWLDSNLYETSALDSREANVEISRPDLVAEKENMAFFMSSIYGLIYLDHSAMPETAATASCGMPIPGIPQNVLLVDDHILVFTKSLDGSNSAVVKFSIVSSQPEFVNALILEDQGIIDARLFNQTLALYLKVLEAKTNEDNTSEPNPPTERNEGTGSPASFMAESMPFRHFNEPKEIYRKLAVINSTVELSIEHSDILMGQGFASEYDYQEYEPEDDRQWSNFNDFLSASGEYLIVSENVRESKFSHYETRYYNKCTAHTRIEKPYQYCKTTWKQIENPDFKPLPLSGLIACGDDLLSCMQTQLPTVSRYIDVADEEECFEGIKTTYQCDSYQTQYYDVAQYDRYSYSNFVVYRFVDGSFSRLDDTLAVFDEINNTLTATDKPFRINGSIEKHDHMSFNDGIFYVINSQQQLSTFAIYGNSATLVNDLPLDTSSGYATNVYFTEDKAFISKGTRNDLNYSQSILQTVSLTDPLRPSKTDDLTIPTYLSQMTFIEDTLIGIGRSYINFDGVSRMFGTAMAFDIPVYGGTTTEANSFILGADHQYYHSTTAYDDQVLQVDNDLNRMIFPYSASNPINQDHSGNSVTRLGLFDLVNGQLEEEHTFDLPLLSKRSLSLGENKALAFNDEEIYSLSKSDVWAFDTIFSGQLPRSIYYLNDMDAQVQVYQKNNKYQLELSTYSQGNPTEPKSGIASIIFEKPKSTYCVYKNLYFDNNRVLFVTEKEGSYHNYRDCPANRADAELTLVGFNINEEGYQKIDDQTALADLYQQIMMDVTCVIDFESEDFYYYDTIPADEDEIMCYSRTKYNELVDNRNNQ